ncbi:hypothetical protein [Roseateles amylovorans]|uniref:Uncharacterized protein n=1 Tax=Roseateles amylovorans TaxID=2978473 RepID=A0ABY6AYR7_9BURK|nr:hypothetical protein [Roseateles amylovorans]UXH78329.1 hypothetical protein N4261_25835 [Roseateles amylovorans]
MTTSSAAPASPKRPGTIDDGERPLADGTLSRGPRGPRGRGGRAPRSVTAAALGLALATGAQADPGYYLVRPYSEPGQTTLDLRYWSVQPPDQAAILWPEVGLRHGFTDRWSSELLLSWIGPTLQSQSLSSINWTHQYLLTQGDRPYDLGLHLQLIRNRDRGNAVEVGPLFQAEWGLTQFNLNLFWAHDAAARRQNQTKLQWQALHRWSTGWRAGLQGFAEPKSWRAGPTWRATLVPGLELQAAWLWGNTYRRRGDMLSAQLQWGF